MRTGQLLKGQAYARRKPHLLDLRDLDRPQRSKLQSTFAKLHEPAAAFHLLELREPLVFGQGSVVMPDGQLSTPTAAAAEPATILQASTVACTARGCLKCGGMWRGSAPSIIRLPARCRLT